MLCAERHLPYDRPPLSKALRADRTDASLPLLRPAAWYDDNRIELRLGERAIALHPRERTVRLATGAALRYDRLLIATGAVPRPVPDALLGRSGVHLVLVATGVVPASQRCGAN